MMTGTRTTNQSDLERGPDCKSLILPVSFASSFEVLMSSLVELERIATVEGPAAGAATRYEERLESGALLATVGGAGMDPSEANDPSLPREQQKDFDNGANPLWSLYIKGVKSRDQARIQTLKDDMDGILLFVCVHLLSFDSRP